jgi:small ligand-binding sensory domain FIST
MIRYAAALSQHPIPVEAVGECVGDVLERFGNLKPDLVVVFATEHYVGAMPDINDAIQKLLEPESLIGCTAAAVAGGGLEVEDGPALSIWAAYWGGGRTTTFHLETVEELEGTRIVGWPEDLVPSGTLLLLADPFSFPTSDFLQMANANLRDLTVIGGIASAGRGPGGNRLLLNTRETTHGAVAVLLDARVPTWTAVSQGCRPIGQPMTITRSVRNVIHELAGQPAFVRLQEVAAAMPDEERELLRNGLHLGIVVDEHKIDFARGDFLVRNVLGANPGDGSVTVGEFVEVGQTVQFHVRDAISADDDLRIVAGRAIRGRRDATAALMFTCNGRGRHLFGMANHDAEVVQELGNGHVAMGGMFCGGEIGPIGGRAFLHGFTASLALFGDEVLADDHAV